MEAADLQPALISVMPMRCLVPFHSTQHHSLACVWLKRGRVRLDTSVPPGPWRWLPATGLLSSIQLIRIFPCSRPWQSSLWTVQDALTAEPRGTMGDLGVTEAQPSVPAGRKDMSHPGHCCDKATSQALKQDTGTSLFP